MTLYFNPTRYSKSPASWKLKKTLADDDVIQEINLKNLRSRSHSLGDL